MRVFVSPRSLKTTALDKDLDARPKMEVPHEKM